MDCGGGGGGSFFGAGDRGVRCPRCDSLNTKFCYYNNYNLSQPRHFCKGCRRYWTKGGVLRNVPVGGGGRKTKRSKPKTGGGASNADDESKSNAPCSSSETSAVTSAAATEEGSTPSSAAFDNFPDSRIFDLNPQADPDFDHANHSSSGGHIFSTEIGSFTSFMSSSEETMGFGIGDIPTTSYGWTKPTNLTATEDKSGPAAANEVKVHDAGNEGLTTLQDWGNGGSGGGGDQELFDLTAGVDPAYWTQYQWTGNDNDQSLNYLP